nr:CoA transferase [Micromonospora sp. DSM 115978]
MTEVVEAGQAPAHLPLAGLRVLDFAWIGAGALVTKALAELGAEIIRIESRSRPDNLRRSPPFRPGVGGLESSGYFASRNPGKKSVALNMKHPRARDIALAMAARCQVFTSNFRTGVLERWGMAYEDVRAVNPSVVFLAMPMQGSDGPHRDYSGFGSTIAALAGLVHTTGLPDRAPVGTGTHYPDHAPNPGHALVAVLAAIYHQQRRGEGQYVELSQLESTVNVVGPGILYSSLGGTVTPTGNRTSAGAPRGVYRCAGGEWVALACLTEQHWQALTAAVDQPALADARFRAAGDRRRHADELDALLSGAFATRPRPEVLAALRHAGVPAGAVNDARDMLDDPRLRARGFWQTVTHPVIGELPMFHLPFRLNGQRRPTMTPPPLLGEHTRDVVAELAGITGDEYESLTADGVFT